MICSACCPVHWLGQKFTYISCNIDAYVDVFPKYEKGEDLKETSYGAHKKDKHVVKIFTKSSNICRKYFVRESRMIQHDRGCGRADHCG